MITTVKASKYVEGVESIYVEKPEYETGHDGSDGKCDCIGMCRGGLIRAGQKNVTNMRGTNQAARKTIRDLQELESEAPLLVGDVVLKVRDKDDPNMPLPDNYRKGGKDYDERWGEKNFTHIGTVTSKHPLEITHMTSPTAKKDKSIKGWTYFGELPWIEYEEHPEPQPEPDPEPDPELAVVYSENGKPVKMRAKPDTGCNLYWKIPCGTVVIVDNWNVKTDKDGNQWALVTWEDRMGYMMSRFLKPEETPGPGTETWTVSIPGLTRAQAEELAAQWPGATIEEGRG